MRVHKNAPTINIMNDFIKTYLKNDPAAKSGLEVLLLYPGPRAIGLHRIAHFLYGHKLYFLARLVAEFSRFVSGIEIHPGARVGRNLFIDHGHGIVIGETAYIGDNVSLYHGVTLGGTSSKREVRHPQVGNDVVIGANATILGPVHIGEKAKVGAAAVVMIDVPAGTTAVGIPAKIIKPKAK